MEETVNKSVHDALVALDLGKNYERVDRRLSEIVDYTRYQAPNLIHRRSIPTKQFSSFF
jgi:hypothetical protein